MQKTLFNCTLSGAILASAPEYSAVVDSLLYQARVLGMQLDLTVASKHAHTEKNKIVFSLQAPSMRPVTCSISDWHGNEPAPATPFIVEAAAGLMSVHGRASGRAQALGIDYVATLTATLALQSALAAMIGQLRGLSVSHVHVSMIAAALLSVSQYVAAATVSDSPEIILPSSSNTEHRPPFCSADGVYFELETLDAEPWRLFWAEAGIDSDTAGKGWRAFLLRYAKAIAPLPGAFTAALSLRSFAEITTMGARSGMAICPLRSLQQRSLDDDAQAFLKQGPWHFSVTDNIASMHAVTSDSATKILPLSGLTVLESCRRIQGPLAGHLLSLMGADVIRIEPLGGDPLRTMPPIADGVSARFDALNRHKTIQEIDIKSAQGQADIYALARHAQVFLHNWAPGKAAEFKLDHTDLHAINPGLVYAYAGGWGKASLDHLPGTDFMVQAYSGIAKQIAESSGTIGGSLFTALDILGGAVAAQGVSAALLAMLLQQRVVSVESSLLGAATLLQAQSLSAINTEGEKTAGSTSLIAAIYPTQQGLLAIECCDAASVARLSFCLGLSDKPILSSDIQKILLTRPASAWEKVLNEQAVSATVVVEDLSHLQHDPRLNSCLSSALNNAVGATSYTHVLAPWRFQ